MSRHKLKFIGTGKNYDVNISPNMLSTTITQSSGGGGGGGDTLYSADDTIGTTRVATLTDTLLITNGADKFLTLGTSTIPATIPATDIWGVVKDIGSGYSSNIWAADFGGGAHATITGTLHNADTEALSSLVTTLIPAAGLGVAGLNTRSGTAPGGAASVSLDATSQNAANVATAHLKTTDSVGVVRGILVSSSISLTIGDTDFGGTEWTIPYTRGSNLDILVSNGTGTMTFQSAVAALGGQGAGLTAPDATATDGTIGTNDTITNNLRVRLDQVEARLQGLGLIA